MHKIYLVKARVEEKTAELNQPLIAEVAAVVQVIAPRCIGPAQSGHVLITAPGKTATDVPETVAMQRQAAEAGIGIEAGHSAVAVEKRVNPHQTVMRCSRHNERSNPMMLGRRISICESLQECRQFFRYQSDMKSDFHFAMTGLTGNNFQHLTGLFVSDLP